MPFRPILDGELMRTHPLNSIDEGSSRAIDLIVGTNRDEFRLFTFAQPEAATLGEETLINRVRGYLHQAGIGIDAPAVIERYRLERDRREESTSARDILEAIGADLVFRLPLLHLASSHSRHGGQVYSYRFDWTSPFAQGALGACHALELPFVFSTTDNPIIGFFSGTGERASALADEMQSAWVAFATSGDPTTPTASWPRYSEVSRATRIFGGSPAVVEAPGEAERSYLDPYLSPFGDDAD
jgi:para-nitrobenzyl esterase